MDAKYVSITNLGVIESVDLTANRAGAASLVRNQGMILGDMTYGNGADKYYGANGVVSGRILGGNGGDLIVTGRADDSVRGGAGNETIVGSLGADTLDGGANTDLVSYVGSPEGITVDLRTGEASGGWAEGDQLIAVENLRGTAFADVIIGSTVANNLRGGNGADHLEGASGDETLRGDAGADTFSGGAVADCATYQGNLDSVQIDLETTGRPRAAKPRVTAFPVSNICTVQRMTTASRANSPAISSSAGRGRWDLGARRQ